LPISLPRQAIEPRADELNSWGIGAYIAFSVGGFFLIMGWSAIETADQSEDLVRGTFIEDDPFSNQLNENMRNSGYSQCITGLVICAIGVFFAGIGGSTQKSTNIRKDDNQYYNYAEYLARNLNRDSTKGRPNRPPMPKIPPPKPPSPAPPLPPRLEATPVIISDDGKWLWTGSEWISNKSEKDEYTKKEWWDNNPPN